MVDEDEQPRRPYTDALVNQPSLFVDNLGPAGNPFETLSDLQALGLLRLWRNGQLPDNHPIKIHPVYVRLPNEILKCYDPTERTPVWVITHLFLKGKLSHYPDRAVYHKCNIHWSPRKQRIAEPNPETIMENGEPVGYKLKLALWAETMYGTWRKTAYRMEEYSLHNVHDPPPSPITVNDQNMHGLYKHGNWVISKIYKGRSKYRFLFYAGDFAINDEN